MNCAFPLVHILSEGLTSLYLICSSKEKIFQKQVLRQSCSVCFDSYQGQHYVCVYVCVCVFMKEWVVNGARVLRKEEEGAGRKKNSMSRSCIMKRFWNLIYKNGCVFSLTSSSLSFLPPHSAQKYWSKMRLSDWSHTPTLGLFWERDFFSLSLYLLCGSGRKDTARFSFGV